jgi:integrase
MLGDFLNQYRAKTTRAMYVSAWVKFLSLVYHARLKGAPPATLDPWVAKYVNDLRNGRRDLARDLSTLGENCRTRRTCLGYQSAIRTLLAGENLSLSPGEERRIHRARSQPHPPVGAEPLTPGKVLRLMEHLDTRGRAILYILLSSGARLTEVLSLRPGDLDLDSRPARFRIRDAGERVSRVAFISREAVAAIRVYLIVRDRFVDSARSRGGTQDPGLLFPLGGRAFERLFALALSKARLERLDPVTGRRTITPRAARGFFAGRMSTVIPKETVAEMMGTTRPLPEPNLRYPEEELARFYLEGERTVTLHRSHREETAARRIAELERLVNLLRERVGEQEGEFARMREILLTEEREKTGRGGRKPGPSG